jgi:hypothetical protein
MSPKRAFLEQAKTAILRHQERKSVASHIALLTLQRAARAEILDPRPQRERRP